MPPNSMIGTRNCSYISRNSDMGITPQEKRSTREQKMEYLTRDEVQKTLRGQHADAGSHRGGRLRREGHCIAPRRREGHEKSHLSLVVIQCAGFVTWGLIRLRWLSCPRSHGPPWECKRPTYAFPRRTVGTRNFDYAFSLRKNIQDTKGAKYHARGWWRGEFGVNWTWAFVRCINGIR